MRRSVIGIGALSLFSALALALAPAVAQQGGAQPRGAQGLRVGQEAPPLNLFDLTGGQVIVLEWIKPSDINWVRFHQAGSFKETCQRFKDQGVVWFGVCPLDAENQGTSPNLVMMERKEVLGIIEGIGLDLPILFDEGGTLARRFGITELPHVVVVGKDGKVAYEGELAPTEGGFMAGMQHLERALEQAVSVDASLPAGAPRDEEPRRRR